MQVLFISQQIRDNKKILNGGNVCSQTLYKSFCFAVGEANIKLISIPEEKGVCKRYMDYFCLRNMYTKKQENQIIDEINNSQYDLIVLDGSWFGKLVERIENKKKVILFLHNIEKDYSMQRFRKNFLTIFKLRSVIHNEKAAVYYADYIFVLNNRDQDLLLKYYRRKADLFLPISIEDKYNEYEKKAVENNEYENFILFVGSYFAPNIEGIIWFVKKVMPYVNKHLIIAGKNMEQLKLPRAQSKVKILGTVDNLSNLYMKSEAVVIPIFSGGGMKVKTAEALMYGKKIYGTNEALEGYEVDNLKYVVKCNTADEFIRNINMGEGKEYYYPEIRERFLKKYEQKNQDMAVKEFLAEFSFEA